MRYTPEMYGFIKRIISEHPRGNAIKVGVLWEIVREMIPLKPTSKKYKQLAARYKRVQRIA